MGLRSSALSRLKIGQCPMSRRSERNYGRVSAAADFLHRLQPEAIEAAA